VQWRSPETDIWFASGVAQFTWRAGGPAGAACGGRDMDDAVIVVSTVLVLAVPTS
jgi:hypothetical protein